MAITMPPLAVPSSLVSTSPVTPTASWNCSACASAFWPWLASSTSSTSCGARGVDALDDAPHLLQLLHQMRLAVQSPGGIGEQHVDAARARRLQRIEHHRARIGARPAARRNAAPVRCAHTFSCSMAAARKVSPAASITLWPSSRRRRASLPMVVVLPEPLTPTTRITNGRCAASMRSGCAQGARISTMLARSAAIRARDVGELLARDARAQSVEDVLGRLDADVRAEQARLELLEDLRIDLAAAEQVGQIVGEPGVAAIEAAAQALEEAGPLVGGAGLSDGVGGTWQRIVAGQQKVGRPRPPLRRNAASRGAALKAG